MALSRGEAPQHLLRGGHAGVVAAAMPRRHAEVPVADQAEPHDDHLVASRWQQPRQ
eukprot:CAMPEP_0179115598 /NCGR_PEP_ID=MMETSP0796-20121207/54182_1 /TAXON_ID=73915 /ORGANISM="Pyrodinium bahamense, Strain pbaha01" /LENGTH=55 /DNA_ID=CAMNT_0020813853 /DNA_START=218 /DNA_END=382 /DNA_ORIENTATION=-